MTTRTTARVSDADLERLGRLNIASLRALHARVFGRATESRDKEYLRRRLRRRLERLAKARSTEPSRPRDARLPPPGTLLRRAHGGTIHEVRVLESGFEYEGKTYGSLSTIAKVITGTTWNGFGFFRKALAERE